MFNAVLITVDTARAMAGHAGCFHRQIRGWTDTAAQIARAAGGFRVRYERVAR